MRSFKWLALAIASQLGWTGIAAAESMSPVLAKVAAPKFRYSLLVPAQSGSVARLLQFDGPIEQGGYWQQALRHPEQLATRTGLDLKMVHSVFQFGEAPGAVTIVRTRPGGTNKVAEALAAREFALSNESGVSIYARGADLAVNLRARDAFDPFGGWLGQSSRIAIYPDRLVEARAWDPLRNALHQLEGARPSETSSLSPALRQHRGVTVALATLAEEAFADGGEILSAWSDFRAMLPEFLFSKVSAYEAGRKFGEALNRARGDGTAACADLRSAAGQEAPPANALPLHMSQLIAVGRKGPHAQLAVAFWFLSRQSAKSAASIVQAKLETAVRETFNSAHPEIKARVIDQQGTQTALIAVLRVRTAPGELVDTADRLLRESTRGPLSRALAQCV